MRRRKRGITELLSKTIYPFTNILFSGNIVMPADWCLQCQVKVFLQCKGQRILLNTLVTISLIEAPVSEILQKMSQRMEL